MAATGQAYLCPEHGLIQRVEIPFGADDPAKFCSITDCDALVSGPLDVVVTKPDAAKTDDKRELRRCAYSLLGALTAIMERVADGEAAVALGGIVEGGYPGFLEVLDRVTGETERPPKSFNRGYQGIVLLAREEETGERNPEAWKQDPDEFMACLREAEAAQRRGCELLNEAERRIGENSIKRAQR